MVGYLMVHIEPEDLNRILDTDMFICPLTVWKSPYPVGWRSGCRSSKFIAAHSQNRIQTVSEVEQCDGVIVGTFEDYGIGYKLMLTGDGAICGNWFDRLRVVEGYRLY